MAKYWLNVALLRVVLPVILVGCTIWRPVGLSIIYLGLMLYSPMVPIPTHRTMRGHTGIYLKTCICLAFIAVIAQITFHVVLLSLPPYGYFLQDCNFTEKLLKHIGFVRLDSASVWKVFCWLLPEFIVLPAVLAIYFLCRFLTRKRISEEDNASQNNAQEKEAEDRNTKIINFLGHIGTYVVLASLCCAAVVQPSIQASFYFLVFLGTATYWACNRELRKGFAVICRIVMILSIVHIIVLLAYQNEWPQEIIPKSWSRYFALIGIYNSHCNNSRDANDIDEDLVHEEYDEDYWLIYAYAPMLFWLYYILALQSQFLSKKPEKQTKRLSGKLESLDTPLSRHVSVRRRTPSQRWQSARRKARKPVDSSLPTIDERTPLMRFGSGRTGLLQNSTTGSIIVNQESHQDDSIQMQSLSEGAPDETPGIVEQVIMAIYSIFQLIVNSSYLASNIIMMVWSIMYHSWTTFVLLLWALFIWMVPNQRAFMMKCSPFIVFYAILLLLGQYVYCLDLTENELPMFINGINISEIGFKKLDQLSRWHLIVKCLFISMFWVTMRQYMKERKRQQQSLALRDMVAPLHVSVTTATTAMNHEAPEIKSEFMINVGKLLHDLLTKFWIAIVAIMLFVSGITGERMTVFRIIYMSLFLFFVSIFQISWTIWRRILFGFWVTVIGYSIIMLICVYIYQFENFPIYLYYIGIDINLQMDIGLETYATKDLFVRLLTPTCFVIITVLQIHYFHKEFLKVTDIDRLRPEDIREASLGHPPEIHIPVSPTDVTLEEESYTMYTLKRLKEMTRLERIALLRDISRHTVNFYNHTWLFLEIHMQKIIFISFILLCINDVCAINFFIVVVVVIIINFSRIIQIKTINTLTVIISLLMVTKMLYQIQYINHDNWNVNCTRNITKKNDASNYTVYNIAEWFGMTKAEPGQLPELLKGYIGMVTVTTFRKIIRVRQWFYRSKKGESLDTPRIMFPTITRADADKGLPQCFKFLFNYGFYKFGLEICFIAIVTLIGTRLDFYSVLYSIWLLLLFSLKRKNVARIWPIFRIFAVILLPMQYAIVVAPPSWLCIEYPWGNSDIMRRLQEWMYLPDPDFPPNAKKLICDFILLMMIVRQSLVFYIEHQTLKSGYEFAAGHNYSVIHDMENPDFVNPVKDFVSHIHSWLDVAKRGIMLSLMWVTLSIMFLAGTKRTNLFSLGYLIGAFIFLWQGSDFYLRPIRTILRSWNILIGYNVIVIFLKAIFQGVGCVLIKDLERTACWLIQLLGIACLKKFKSSADIELNPTECIVSREDIGMVWDGLCFAFLLMQKRLFKSYYFFHIVDETKAMSILASRGAELLENLYIKRVELQENVEKAVLEKLKFKMDKIKATQQKIKGPLYREPETHKIDELYPRTRPLYRIRTPKTKKEAIRSGDYYMFDELDDDIPDIIPHGETETAEREFHREQEKIRRRMTLSELKHSLLNTDDDIVRHVGESEKDAQRLRRRSVPLTRKKSSMSYLSARSETDTAMATDGPDETSLTSVEMETGEKEVTDLAKSPDVSDKRDDEREDEECEEEESEILFVTYFNFILEMINSMLMRMTKYLNRFSHDYRYIRKILAIEKKVLKAKSDFKKGLRLGINQIWQPLMQGRSATNGTTEDSPDAGQGPSQLHSQDESMIIASNPKNEKHFVDSGLNLAPKESSLAVPHIRILAPSLERGLDMSSSSTLFSQALAAEEDEEDKELSEVDQPPIIQLAASIWFAFLAHSSLLCYFMVFLHQIKNASVLSMPLPFMVFLWGTLTVPRPSKTFWVTIIAYVEIIVIIKCIFQMELIWTQEAPPSSPLYIPRIMGIEKRPNYALWELLLLLMLFFHRLMLKSLGQWTVPSQKVPHAAPSNPSLNKTQEESDVQTDTHLHQEGDEEQSLNVPDPAGEASVTSPTHQNKLVAKQEVNLGESFIKVIDITTTKCIKPVKDFFNKIITPVGKEKTNVYAYMFFCDFFNFLLLIFGFAAFGTAQENGGLAAYLEENRVPMPFLLMLLVQFFLIVIDRALYLKKSILGKLIFQYCLVFGVHIWMFFLLPSVTERRFNENLAPQIWYMVKCLYLLFSAYQLRQGYPTRILGNFLCKKYTMLNYVLFKGFMLIPFLFELRAVMDWIWTDTSMTIMDWFKMEDIFASIYQLKCTREFERNYPQNRGEKTVQWYKYLMGGFTLFLIIGLIWFPLLLFALGSTVGLTNIPYDVTLKVRIGSYEPIYSMSAQGSDIFQYTEKQYEDLTNIPLYTIDRWIVTFFENYDNSDVTAVRFSSFSKNLWNISPPDKKRLKEELASTNTTVTVHVEWTVSRKTDVRTATGITTTIRNINLPPYVNEQFNPARQTLVDMLTDDNDTRNATIILEHALPKFLKVTTRAVSIVSHLMRPRRTHEYDDNDDDSYMYRNISLHLTTDKVCCAEWWIINEMCKDNFHKNVLSQVPLNDCNDYVIMILFNDKAFPESLTFISGLGILGLYTTAVIVISQMMRKLVVEMAPKIMFEDLPYVDRILRLCLDVYLVRESGDMFLEEDLFAKLIFLYRSPETLIRWTRIPIHGERTDLEEEEELLIRREVEQSRN